MSIIADLTRDNAHLAASRDQLRLRRDEILDALLLATAELERQAPMVEATMRLERAMQDGEDITTALIEVLAAAARYRIGDA